MKTFSKIAVTLAFAFLLAPSAFSKNSVAQQDTMKLIEQYSLFSEYYKTKDYETALPYAWEVLKMDPQKFAQWIYYKMEDALWILHDSTDISEVENQALEDTILYFYDTAIENYPGGRGYFQVRKAFVMETWLDMPAEEVIPQYEEAIQNDKEISSYYYHRLGQLYKAGSDNNEEYKSKALDLYTYLSEKEPDNSQWPQELESLVDNIDQLVELTRKNWENDRENLGKAWKYASLAMRANSFEDAIVPLEFLVTKSPESLNYYNQLATAYQKLERIDKAEEMFKKLIQLEPNKKEHYLNLGIILKDKGQLAAARTQYRKASEVGGGWGLPIFYEGLLYEQAARGCTFDFNTKLVYQLAVDTYRKARSMDPSVTQAQERIGALSNSVPTKEDYFFRQHKSGQTLPITGDCFGWIGGSVTVP